MNKVQVKNEVMYGEKGGLLLTYLHLSLGCYAFSPFLMSPKGRIRKNERVKQAQNERKDHLQVLELNGFF